MMTMASNIISRLLPSVPGEPSIYETFQQHDNDASDQSDIHNSARMALDEENYAYSSHENPLDTAEETDSLGIPRDSTKPRQARRLSRAKSRTRIQINTKGKDIEDIENEVPHSLLIEDEGSAFPGLQTPQPLSLPPPVPGPSSRTIQAKWRAAQQEQRLHQETPPPSSQQHSTRHRGKSIHVIDPKDRATWMWINVENLDRFLSEVYEYYTGHGIWSMLLSRVVKLL